MSKLKISRLKCEFKFDLYYKLTTNKKPKILTFEVFRSWKT